MKRVYKLLILFLVLCVPVVVKADMGAPMIKEYKATVINPEGIDYYRNEYNKETKEYESKKVGHLNSGDTFTVLYENEKGAIAGDKAYLACSLGDGWENNFFIYEEDIKGVRPVESEFIPNDENIKDIGKHYKSMLNALTNAEVNLYKGPSIAYEVITTIPKETKLSYEYVIGDTDETGTVYIYTEYNGNKGWISVLDAKVLFEYSQKNVTFEDIQTDCGVIPAGTVFTSRYVTDMWDKSVSYETDGCRALVNNFRSEKIATYYDSDTYYEVKRDIRLYEKPKNKGKIVYTIKKGSQITINYTNESEEEYSDYYFEIDGQKGFVFLKTDSGIFEYIDRSKVTSTTSTSTTTEETTSEEITTDESYSLGSTNSKTSVEKTKEIIIISTIVGVALALTAIVIIVIVNKKNKNTKEEVKPETGMTENDLNLVSQNVEQVVAPVETQIDSLNNENDLNNVSEQEEVPTEEVTEQKEDAE